MPLFTFNDDDYDYDDDEENDVEPPHPLGFESSSSSSPWGKSWISLDPPSRVTSSRGRSTYALDDEDDEDDSENDVDDGWGGVLKGHGTGTNRGILSYVQSYPPLSSYIRADIASTAALLRPSPQQLKQKQRSSSSSSATVATYGDRTLVQRREDDDLNYSDDDDDDDVDENDVALLFQQLGQRLNTMGPSSTPSALLSAALANTTSAVSSPSKRRETEQSIERRIQVERQRVDEGCRQIVLNLGELVLQIERDADTILQKRYAEEERIRLEHERVQARQKQILDEQAAKEAKEKQEGDELKRQEQIRQEQDRAAREKQAKEAQALAGKATEHVEKAKKLVGQLVQVRASIEPFDQNKAVAKRRLQMKKIARGKINTLSENAQKVMEVASDVSRAISDARQEDEQIKQGLQRGDPGLTPDMARGKRYLADLIASVTMQRVQAESFNGPRGDGFPLAAMLSLVTAENKDLSPIIAAHIYTVCPTAIPTLPTLGPDATEDDVMTGLGMHRDKKTGEFESFPQFLSRTENIISFVAQLESSQPGSHNLMGGHNGAVLWLNRFLDLLPPAPTAPLPLITAPVLGAFLSGAGHMLANKHAEDFQRCLDSITSDIIHRLDEGEIGKPFSIRLNKLLEGGFDFFLKNLPSRAIAELYYGASAASHKHVDTLSFGGTIGETTDEPPRGSATTVGGDGGVTTTSAGSNPFGGGGGNSNASPFGSSQGPTNTNPFGGSTAGGGGISSSTFQGGTSTSQNQQPQYTKQMSFESSSLNPGVGSNPSSTSSSSLFGTQIQNPPSSSSVGLPSSGFGRGFGSTGATNPSPFGGGGGATSASSVNPSPFGGGGTAANPSPFGGTAANPSPFSGTAANPPPFGGTAANPSPFGGTAANPSPFGGGAPVTNPSPFGNAPVSNPSPFGSGPASNPSPFGGAPESNPSPFGGAPTTAQSPFGSGQSALGASPFGGSIAAPSPSPFGIGGISSAAPSKSSFGGGFSSSSFGGGMNASQFGGSSGIPQSKPFGSNSSAPLFGNTVGNTSSTPFGGSVFGGGGQQRQQTGFGSSGNSSFGGGAGGGGNKPPCKFFAEGRCKFGNNCNFSHDIGPGGGSNPSFGGGGGFGSTNTNISNNTPFGRPRR